MSAEIGKRIKEARLKKGLTMVQLAKIARITQPQISNYEGGHLQPNTSILGELAKALDVTTDYLSLGRPVEKFAPFEGLSQEDQSKVIDYINTLKKARKFEVIESQVR